MDVREAAGGAPVAGAFVAADVPSRNHPFSVASLLGQTASVSTRATTDDAGRATLEHVDDRPFRLTVIPPGGAPESALWDAPDETWRPLGKTEVRAR